MDQDLREMIEETHALAKDNHQMLRSIRRGQWISFFWKVAILAIALALPLYLYQNYIEPIVAKIPAVPGVTAPSLFNLPSSTEIQKLVNSLKTAQ